MLLTCALIGFKWSSWYLIRSSLSLLIISSRWSLHSLRVIRKLHSLMIGSPLCPDKLALLIDLVFEIISESIESVNEVLFKCIESWVHDIHLLDRILLVISDVSVLKIKQVNRITYKCWRIVIRASSWTRYEHSSYLQSPETCPSSSFSTVKGFHSRDVSALSYL